MGGLLHTIAVDRLRTMMPGAEAIHLIKLNDVDPRAWLANVLKRLPDHSAKRIHELLPWNWKPEIATTAPLEHARSRLTLNPQGGLHRTLSPFRQS